MPNQDVKERNIGHVLQTAYTLFLAHGIENTTKEMLVRASGVSRSSIDRYFPSKADWVLDTAMWVGANLQNTDLQLQTRFAKADYSGLAMLKIYMETIRDSLYENPRQFVLGMECRAFAYRNCANYETGCGRLYRALGASALLKQIFEIGGRDGSMRADMDAAREAVLTRESLLGFFSSIAMSYNQAILADHVLVDRHIERTLRFYTP